MEELLRAFERWQIADKAHDRAFQTYEGGSWGYHGSDLIHARDHAREDFGKELNKAIDSRAESIVKALVKHEALMEEE